ncbi:MAG: TIM barrel protein [Eubacterium sp.]
MKLGFVSAIFDQSNYEEMMDIAGEMGFACVEVACWPQGKAERRYAGVSHIDVDRVLSDDAYAEHILTYAKKKGLRSLLLHFIRIRWMVIWEKRAGAVEHLKTVIAASAKLGVNLVTTFIGRDQSKTVKEYLELVKEIWPPILSLAEEKGVRIASETFPMLFRHRSVAGRTESDDNSGKLEKDMEIFRARTLE